MPVILILFMAAGQANTLSGAASLPQSLDLDVVRALVVQHDGRYAPLDTVARDIVNSVTGEAEFAGEDPVKMLLAWTFDAPTWQQQPLIRIANPELRRHLRLPPAQSTFSYVELIRHQPLRELIEGLSEIPQGRKPDPLESKVGDIHDKLLHLQEVFQGQALRLLPDADDITGVWQPIRPVRGGGVSPEIAEMWGRMQRAYLADDARGFSAAASDLAAALRQLPSAYRPDEARIAIELRYNRLRPFRIAWIVMAVGALLSALAMLVKKRWFDAIAAAALLTGFVILSYGLHMRWQIAGRIPAANMFESLLFLSWGMGAFAIVAMIVQRQRLVPLTASFMGALALLIAEELPLDSFVRPIPPVLNDTIWMSIHVPVIMVSYSVLALAVLIAHVQLAVLAFGPARSPMTRRIDGLHYWYVHVGSILLLIGIVTGSMWAASSWGRYWGWDPKEVWSLVALLAYLAILHVRIDRDKVPRWAFALVAVMGLALMVIVVNLLAPLSAAKSLAFGGVIFAVILFIFVRGPFATAFKSILAFWMIIMTYVGVNYVLGIGLHSYGFGTGAVASRMFMFGGIDLALVALCAIVYVARFGLRAVQPTSAAALRTQPRG